MWTTTTESMTFNGSVMLSLGSISPPVPLRGVLVHPYRFTIDNGGNAHFESLEFTDRTESDPTKLGDFTFTDLWLTVEVDTIVSSIPPYDTYKIVRPSSLPNLAFRIFVESEVLSGDASSVGTQYTIIYDEREEVDPGWLLVHPDRAQVPLTGSVPLLVLVPEGTEEAVVLTGMPVAPVTVPPHGFHFLRIGRAVRQELGELGDTRLDYAGKAGYFTSSNEWSGAPPQPSFFPNQRDAPFGRTLHIGGQFGPDFLPLEQADELYYHVDFSRYSGAVTAAYNPADRVDTTQVQGRLFNKKYLPPSIVPPKGEWQTIDLGTFPGTITAVEPPHDPGLVGTGVDVYKRPRRLHPDEYWPFWDLMLIWNSQAAPNELIVLTIDVYQRTGGTITAPELKKLAVTPLVNDHLPLLIDNRSPVPKFQQIDTGTATFAPPGVGGETALGDCGFMQVAPSPPNNNECLAVRYSVEDGAGSPHLHVKNYRLWVEYTRRGALSSSHVPLRSGFVPAPYVNDISGGYSASTPPHYYVNDYRSVLVPVQPEGWPPESNGDSHPLGPCPAYAAEVSLGCRVRTVNGWGGIFGQHHVSRHIIIRV